MTRPEARDAIRVAAEIPGEDVFDYLLNLYLDQELAKWTALRRYNEAKVVREQAGAWLFSTEHGQFVVLPTIMQHLNEEEIYFAEDNDLTQLRRLIPWSSIHLNQTGDLPLYFQVGNEDIGAGPNSNVLYVYPQEDLNIANDFIYISYWKALTWNDTYVFPIRALEGVVIDKVIERIASLQKSGLAKKHAQLAKEAYQASRGQNI